MGSYITDYLIYSGLNLKAVFKTDGLPEDVTAVLREHVVDFDTYARLVMLGHGGRRLWVMMQEYGFESENPIDSYSIRVAEVYSKLYLEGNKPRILYPLTNIPLPLQSLGSAAGWNHVSPLGIGINEEFGLWHAYRVVFLTHAELDVTVKEEKLSPCDSCIEKPCISVCPAKAVKTSGFDVESCCRHRISDGSACATQCLARLACPVGAGHRYYDEQIAYHYGLSLETVKRYFGTQT